MKKFEKFVFLSDYRLVTAKVRDPESRSGFRATRYYPGHVAVRRRRIIRLENERVTRARTGNRSGRGRRDTVGAANPGEKLAPAPDKTRKQPRTRLQLPCRGTNCAAGVGETKLALCFAC